MLQERVLHSAYSFQELSAISTLDMPALEKRVQNTLARYSLLPRGSVILVAVSGGPDSMCLLSLLAKLAPQHDWTLRVAHVNYQLRSADSDRDEKIVRNWAKEHHVPVSVKRITLAQRKATEAHLRDIRYAFFESIRQKYHGTAIAVAHTQDDQAETILLRLLRGAGTKGLRAMQPKNGFIVRPLLFESRKNVLAYLSKHALPFGEDITNISPLFTRNRVRHELLPLLESQFNPNIKETLAKSALSIADDESFLDECAQKLFPERETKKGEVSFRARNFLTLHTAIARRFLRTIATEHAPAPSIPTFDEIEEMRRLIGSAKNKVQKKAFRGLNIEKKGDRVRVIFHQKF